MNDSAIFGMLGLLIGIGLGGAIMGAYWCYHHVMAMAEARAAHSRLSDAHNTQSARIERALAQETPGANATVVRMARILKGDL